MKPEYLADLIDRFFDVAMAPFAARLAAVERQFATLPTPRDGLPGRDGKDGEKGADGAPGRDGRDGANGADGISGTSGRDGRDGKDGEKGTDGKDGADGLGFDDLSLTYDGERTLTLRFVRGTQVREFPIVAPWPMHRGVWREGATHQRGDSVTYGGSLWIAQRDTQAKPEEGDDWKLAVKRGRDGKDGAKGEKGDQGPSGRNGRDLTNLGADGSKWA